MSRARLLVLASLVALAPSFARAETPQEQFDRATGLIGQRRYREAAEALVATADSAPRHRLAADALFSAAELYEERLADPARAADLYRRLLDDYPDSRRALGAERRLSRLRAALGPKHAGSEPLSRFLDIKQHFAERGEAASIERARTLLDEHPDWPGAPRVALWLAQVHERAGRLERAAGRYAEVLERWPDSPEAFAARLGAGHIALARGQLSRAERQFSALAPRDPGARRARDEALSLLAHARRRRWLYRFAFAALLAAALALLGSLRAGAGSWQSAARALRRPPTEVLYMAPVAALLSAAAFTDFAGAAPAVAIIAAGGLGLTWLSGAGLRVAPASRRRSLLHAAASVVGVASLCYIALYRLRLLDVVFETVRHGPSA